MSLRALLVGLIVAGTAGFVVGTSIERHNAHHESAAHVAAERGTATTPAGGEQTGEAAQTGEANGEAPAEGSESHSDEHTNGSTVAEAPSAAEPEPPSHAEPRPLGVDVESVPFIVLGALASLGLALLGWLRPRWLPGLIVIAVAMAVFGALDIREVFHQGDENNTGLAIVAAVVAALHVAAAAVAVLMATRRHSDAGNPPTAAATIPL